MTPFDPVALVAMLLAFYPEPSAAAFAAARRDRPDYFSGGVIFGSKGDKLRLPDGREWDCIVAAGGPPSGRRWGCTLIVFDPTAPDDPFVLEDGPLVPLDETVVLPPIAAGSFQALVGDGLSGFGDSEGQLFRAEQSVLEFPGAGDLEGADAHLFDDAVEQHEAFRRALVVDNPIDELEAAGGHGDIIDSSSSQYDEDPPPDIDPDSGPIEPPGGGGELPPPA